MLICKSCGYPKEEHNFRHPYLEEIKVDYLETENVFLMNASDFFEKKIVKCNEPFCNSLKSLHNENMIQHPFVPIEQIYRDLRFFVPSKIPCAKSGCELTLENHKEEMTHKFTVKVKVENKYGPDKIIPIHKELDFHIISI